MRTITLFGHTDTVQAVYMYLDHLLRERKLQVQVVQTTMLDQATARGLHQAGGELWYCGPNLTPPGGGWSPVTADAYLLSGGRGALACKVVAALTDFQGRTPRVAT